MLRRILASAVVMASLLLGTSSAFADGNGATTQTYHFHNQTDTFVESTFCSTQLYQITETYNAVAHVTVRPGGSYDESTDTGTNFSETYTETGSFVAVPLDGNGPTYSGHVTIWDGGAVNQNGVAEFTFTGTINGTGSDGSTIHQHETAHFNVNPNHANMFDKLVGC